MLLDISVQGSIFLLGLIEKERHSEVIADLTELAFLLFQECVAVLLCVNEDNCRKS